MVQQDTVQADQAAQPGIPTNAQTGLLRACTLGMGGNTLSPSSILLLLLLLRVNG